MFWQIIIMVLEKIGFAWLCGKKQKEVENARADVDALSDTELDKRVYDDITKK